MQWLKWGHVKQTLIYEMCFCLPSMRATRPWQGVCQRRRRIQARQRRAARARAYLLTSRPWRVPQVATMKPLLPSHPYLGDIANSIANHFGLGGKLTAEDTDAYDAAARQAIDDDHHK
jgi:hypothetical protein